MRELYLHIGYPKTGTTAIQEFLHLNKARLLERNVLYPETGLVKYAHHLIPWVFTEDKRNKNGVSQADIIDRLQTELDQNRTVEKVVISSEGFIFAMSPEDVAEIFKDNFESIKLVIYLRQPFRWIVSDYNQGVKGWRQLTCDFDEHFNRVLQTKGGPLDFYSMLSKWAGVFGWDNIVVRTYDMEKENLLNGFLDIVGISDHVEFERPQRHDSNPRLSADRLELLRLVNSFELSSEKRSSLLDQISKLKNNDASGADTVNEEKFYYCVDEKKLGRINSSNKKLLRYLSNKLFDNDFFSIKHCEKDEGCFSQIKVQQVKEIVQPIILKLLDDKNSM